MSLWWFEYLWIVNEYSEYSYLQKASQTHHSCHLALAALTVAWFCFSVSYLRDKTLRKEASRSWNQARAYSEKLPEMLVPIKTSSLISKLANIRFCKPGGSNNLLIPDPWKFTSNRKSLKYWLHHPQKKITKRSKRKFLTWLSHHKRVGGTPGAPNIYSQQQI